MILQNTLRKIKINKRVFWKYRNVISRNLVISMESNF